MSSRIQGLSFAALLLVLLAAPAWAAEAEEGEKPSLMTIDLWAAITAVVTFLLLLWILKRYAWGPMLGAMQSREERIKQALDEAAAANERARELIAEYEARIDKAREESRAIAEEARRDAETIRARIQDDARREADVTIERAKREIDQAVAAARETLVHEMADIATDAARRIVGRELSDADHSAIVSDVVHELAERRRAAAVGGGTA